MYQYFSEHIQDHLLKHKSSLLLTVWVFILFSALGVCWKLFLDDCFWILNAVQIIYISAALKTSGKGTNTAISGKKAAAIAGLELLAFAALAALFRFMPNFGMIPNYMKSKVFTLLILCFLVLALAIFLRQVFRGTSPFSPFMVNLFAFASTLVVLRANQYVLSPSMEAAMEQILWSCCITYSIHLLFLVCKIMKEKILP